MQEIKLIYLREISLPPNKSKIRIKLSSESLNKLIVELINGVFLFGNKKPYQ